MKFSYRVLKIAVILFFVVTAVVFAQSPDTLYPAKVFTESSYKYGYINNEGYLSIKPQYAYAKEFSEGLAFVKNDTYSEIWICIDTEGNYIFEVNAKYVYSFQDSIALLINEIKMITYVNHSGNIFTSPDLPISKLLPPEISFFKKNDKFGYKKITGDTVLSPIYERAGEFSEGLAPVFIKFKESDLPEDNCYNAFINEKGDVIIKAELKYDDKGYLESGYFFSPGKWQNGVCRYYTSNDPLTRAEKYIRSDGKIIW